MMPLRYQGGGGDGAPEPAVPWNLAAVTGPDPPVATPAPHSPGGPASPRRRSAVVGRRTGSRGGPEVDGCGRAATVATAVEQSSH